MGPESYLLPLYEQKSMEANTDRRHHGQPTDLLKKKLVTVAWLQGA